MMILCLQKQAYFPFYTIVGEANKSSRRTDVENTNKRVNMVILQFPTLKKKSFHFVIHQRGN
jgi:hypothetical protein